MFYFHYFLILVTWILVMCLVMVINYQYRSVLYLRPLDLKIGVIIKWCQSSLFNIIWHSQGLAQTFQWAGAQNVAVLLIFKLGILPHTIDRWPHLKTCMYGYRAQAISITGQAGEKGITGHMRASYRADKWTGRVANLMMSQRLGASGSWTTTTKMKYKKYILYHYQCWKKYPIVILELKIP